MGDWNYSNNQKIEDMISWGIDDKEKETSIEYDLIAIYRGAVPKGLLQHFLISSGWLFSLSF